MDEYPAFSGPEQKKYWCAGKGDAIFLWMTRISSSLCLLLLGCATPVPVSTPPTTSHPATVTGDESVLVRLSEEPDAMRSVINAPQERVWRIIPLVYAKLEIDGQVLDSDNQIFGSRKFTNSSLDGTRTAEFVRCGEEGAGPALVNLYRRTLSIVSTVSGNINGKTTVSTEISGYATSVEGTSTGPMRCASNGKLEKRIRTLLNELLPPSCSWRRFS